MKVFLSGAFLAAKNPAICSAGICPDAPEASVTGNELGGLLVSASIAASISSCVIIWF